MDLTTLIDNNHGVIGLVLSGFVIVLMQLLIKGIDLFFKGLIKKDAKRGLDLQRAFKAIRILAGPEWEKIREEIMKDEKFDS
jgi:hypothetical protein